MGGAIFFVLTLVVTMVVGTFVFAYAAHCFFTVVEQTAAGNDEVDWPNVPYVDWLWEVVYILWLAALWMAPFAFTANSRAGTAGLIVSAALVWLFFPISLLSSMSASTRWALVSPALLRRLLGQRFGSLLLFYLHSGPVLAAAVVLVYLSFFRGGGLPMLFVTAAGLAAALLIYARLIGRLAHLISHTRDPVRRSVRRTARQPAHVRAASHDPWDHEENRPRQPSELPPVMSPLEGPITGYDVRFDDQPVSEPDSVRSRDPAGRRRPPDLDDVPYELQGSPTEAPPRGPMPRNWMEPPEHELALARGSTPPPPPAHPWVSGVYNFLLYSKTFPNFGVLAVGLAFLGFLIAALIELNPT
jgi:hypothetical protein